MGDKNNQNLPSSGHESFIVNLMGDEVIVKWTEYNNSVGKTKTTFEKYFPNSLFVRIVRVGPLVRDRRMVPGNIAIIGMGVGYKLDAYTFYEGCDHIILRERDILHHVDLD